MAIRAHSPTFNTLIDSWAMTGQGSVLWHIVVDTGYYESSKLKFVVWIFCSGCTVLLPAAAGRENSVCLSGLLVWSSASLELKIRHLSHWNLTADFKSLLVSLKSWSGCLIWNCELKNAFVILHVIFRLVKLHVNCKTDVKIPSENDNSQPNINLDITPVLFMPLVGYLGWWLINLWVMPWSFK